MFSKRTGWDRAEEGAARALAEARGEEGVTDLTESNPTRVGLGDLEGLVALLGHPRGARYEPEALGHAEARAAVAGYHREHGAHVEPSRVAITASTSEAYAYLFKLLCDRGDRVLAPAPSYPLFELLAGLEDVALDHYPLVLEEGFRIDRDAFAEEVDERTRAIVVVHPNNPTGHFVRRDDAAFLDAFAAERGLALIVDEVFVDYALGDLPRDLLPSFAGDRAALTFVLGGLSKACLLPQLKLGWIAVFGPAALADEAVARLEVIADTYLSVATPVQRALPEILAARGPLQASVRARTSTNLAALDAILARSSGAVRRLPLDGGWYATLEVPRTRDEDAWVELLAREARVLVQPGWFFDMERDGYLVVSLLPEPISFEDAARRVVTRLHAAE